MHIMNRPAALGTTRQGNYLVMIDRRRTSVRSRMPRPPAGLVVSLRRLLERLAPPEWRRLPGSRRLRLP